MTSTTERTRMIIHTPARRFGGALAVLSVVAVLAACAPASSTDDASPVSESADSTEDTSGTDAQPGERIEYTGASEAHVVFDAVPMRFAGDGTADGGWCVQRTNGMLDVELHLVEIDGKPFSGTVRTRSCSWSCRSPRPMIPAVFTSSREADGSPGTPSRTFSTVRRPRSRWSPRGRRFAALS